MPGREPLVELLAALAAVLQREARRWYLFGAQAAILWGRPRLTADVDVTVEIEPEEVPRFVATMAEAGFRIRVEEPERFAERTGVLPFVHPPSGLPLDLVIAGPGLEQDFLARAVPVDLGGLSVPVISPEDLVVAKILAGRSKDLEDLRGILAERRTSLDLVRIYDLLELLEKALDRSDLRTVLDAELER